jgi:hypothetical protein
VFIFPFQELARRHLAVSMGGCRDSTWHLFLIENTHISRLVFL